MVGGLSQLDRLSRNAREAWPGAEVLLVGGEAPGAGGAKRVGAGGGCLPHAAKSVLLLSTDLVVGRGVLSGLAAAARAGAPVPVRLLSGVEAAPGGKLDRDHLAALLPTGANVPSSQTGFWVVLGDGLAPRDAERRLLASLGKPSDGYVARHLNRVVSTRLTGVLARTGVTPDVVSLGVLALALAAAGALTMGTPEGFLLGCLLNQGASMLDGTDGELARLKFLETRRGAWLDTAIDLFGNHLFIVALGLGLSRQPGLSPGAGTGYLVEGLVTATTSAACVWLIARFTRRTSGEAHFNNFNAPLLRGAAEGGWLRRAFAAAVPLFRRDSYALIFLCLALLGKPAWVLHGLALGVAAHLPAITWVWWKHRPGLAQAHPGGGAANA